VSIREDTTLRGDGIYGMARHGVYPHSTTVQFTNICICVPFADPGFIRLRCRVMTFCLLRGISTALQGRYFPSRRSRSPHVEGHNIPEHITSLGSAVGDGYLQVKVCSLREKYRLFVTDPVEGRTRGGVIRMSPGD
jgi:hypothetical protein